MKSKSAASTSSPRRGGYYAGEHQPIQRNGALAGVDDGRGRLGVEVVDRGDEVFGPSLVEGDPVGRRPVDARDRTIGHGGRTRTQQVEVTGRRAISLGDGEIARAAGGVREQDAVTRRVETRRHTKLQAVDLADDVANGVELALREVDLQARPVRVSDLKVPAGNAGTSVERVKQRVRKDGLPVQVAAVMTVHCRVDGDAEPVGRVVSTDVGDDEVRRRAAGGVDQRDSAARAIDRRGQGDAGKQRRVVDRVENVLERLGRGT
ncbi:MAG: hypothetical protein R3C10_10590 [Pirellulales bacterium]